MKRSSLCTTSDTDCPPKKSKVTWTGWDSILYKEALAVYGRNWKKVAGHLKNKSPNQVKSRHQRMNKRMQKEEEKNFLLDQRQAIIYKYVEANVDITSAQMEKAKSSTDGCEILICDELFKYILSKLFIGSLELPTLTIGIIYYIAAEIIKDDLYLPFKESSLNTANSQLLSMNQSSVNKANLGVPSEIPIPRTEEQQPLHSKVLQRIDIFNDFSGKNHHYKMCNGEAEFGSGSC